MRQSMKRDALVLALAAAGLCAASCGGGAKCSVSFSGAFSGTYSCIATGTYSSSNNAGATAGLLVNASGALSYFSFGLNTPADLHTGTYGPDPSFISGGTLILASGPHYSEATVQSTNTGTFSLKLDGIDTVGTSNGNKAYVLHGTLDETLLAASGGATGTVTVHASF